MKNLKMLLSAMLFIVFTTGALAQNNNYKSQTVSPSGVLTDHNNTTIGTIESDGTFKNANGEVIGKLVKNAGDPSKFDFSDKTGKKVATVLNNGTVVDTNGKVLYTVSAPDAKGYCKVFDTDNKEIGMVHEDHKHKGAVLMHATKKK